jgi:phenylacetate-CoA ligase
VLGRLLERNTVQGGWLRQAGLAAADDLASLADLQRLPFTTKADLREHYPFGLLAVPREEVVRVHASSGTRGKPTVVGYTRQDLAFWSEVMARCLAMGGVGPGTVVHNAYGYGLFTGGLGFHQGAELIGCTVVPISGGLTHRQVMMLQDLGAEALCCTPSYALHLAQKMREQEVEPASLRLRVGFFGAEPWTEPLRDEIERQLGLTALNTYGLSEIVGPGVAAECLDGRAGSHLQEDHFLAEVVNPESGERLPAGEEGELVLTTLTKQALPLVRYRTGDIASLDPAPCVCGRTTARMSRVRGRHDDMLIIRGVNLYPSEVERILLGVAGVAPHYQLVVERPDTMDELTVLCEPTEDGLNLAQLEQQLRHRLYQETGITILVQLQTRGSVPRSEGKAVRVVDRRPH